MTKKRIEWLDFARVFVMFLVIVDHLGLENRFIRDFIWSFHMPAFFFISGIFHSNKLPWGEFLKKNFFRLFARRLMAYHLYVLLGSRFLLCNRPFQLAVSLCPGASGFRYGIYMRLRMVYDLPLLAEGDRQIADQPEIRGGIFAVSSCRSSAIASTQRLEFLSMC